MRRRLLLAESGEHGLKKELPVQGTLEGRFPEGPILCQVCHGPGWDVLLGTVPLLLLGHFLDSPAGKCKDSERLCAYWPSLPAHGAGHTPLSGQSLSLVPRGLSALNSRSQGEAV